MRIIPRHTPARIARALSLSLAVTSSLGGVALPAVAASESSRVPVDPAFSRPDPRRMPSRAALRSFLAAKASTSHANTFCFVQRRLDRPDTSEPGTSVLSMIWYEGESVHRINRVRPGQSYVPDRMDPDTEGRMLAYATGVVNLKTDVVPTDTDVGTSTSLVSRSWVDRILMQCRRAGTTVRIPAFKPPMPKQ
ncbi:hypothetical protein [Paracidovorax avenae]|uniref:hypothetical protein n=1 Tax=Paracidovorax avenae TaxID=80867 RepID=UPI0009DA7E31|nr:hypothetical protein [Paracidovorax avenae]AVS65490.1 hypothetical protein C8245_07110 [Paracidovorax avenae]